MVCNASLRGLNHLQLDDFGLLVHNHVVEYRKDPCRTSDRSHLQLGTS